MIIRFLHFYKTKWQTIHKQSDVRSELILSVFTSKLSCKMECVVYDVIKVNQFYRRYGLQTIIKATSQIVIIQFFPNIFQNLKIFSLMSGIQILKLPFKYLQKNIRVTVIDRAILIFTQLAEVSISYSGEVNHCRHLYPCRFRELFHFTCLFVSSQIL